MKSINCPECGYTIQDGSTFCKMCGCRIDSNSQTADENTKIPEEQLSVSNEQNTIQAAPEVPGFHTNGAVPQYQRQYPSAGSAPQYSGSSPVINPVPQQRTYPGQYSGNIPGQYAPAVSVPPYISQPRKTTSSGKKLWIILSSVIGGILLVAGISLAAVYFTAPDRKYTSACNALEEQRFDEAYDGFISLGTYRDSKDKAKEAMYKKGVYLVQNKKYKDASDIFKALDNYEDSSEQYQSAYYNYGLELIGNGEYSDAIDVFTSLGDYSDSRTMIDEAKYCYIVNHMDNSDTTTYSFLNELIAVNYKDCKELYNTIYAWKATNFFFNTDGDSKDKKTSISKSSPLYCHFTIEGGPPEGSFYAYASAFWPNGSKMNKQKSSVVMYSGGTFWWGWKDGIYIDPANGKTGTFTLVLYDENNNEIGRSSVKITE